MSGPIPNRDQKEMLPEGTLAPSATLDLVTGVDLALNAPTITALIAGTHALYVIGQIRYVDVFGRAHETDFLMFCTKHLMTSGSVAGYKTGNRIT